METNGSFLCWAAPRVDRTILAPARLEAVPCNWLPRYRSMSARRASSQHPEAEAQRWGGGGAGSGGAILLEAPVVRVAGIVAVNGGGGGAPTLDDAGSGQSGHDDAMTAKGGAGKNAGGDGSSLTQATGGPGIYMTAPCCGSPNSGGGGGGGAGRIRINTTAGTADITGTLSPAASTACMTMGMLGA
jgi:hypothetical protein